MERIEIFFSPNFDSRVGNCFFFWSLFFQMNSRPGYVASKLLTTILNSSDILKNLLLLGKTRKGRNGDSKTSKKAKQVFKTIHR